MAIVDDSSSLVITYIWIIGYLLIIITVLPIFYKRLINPLAIEIFPGEKIIYYWTYDEQIIYFSDIVHIELIKNPWKADTKSIHIETEKERESQILWKFLWITILNWNQNIKINLWWLLEDSDDIYKKILLEYKEALKSSMKELW